MPVVEYYAHQGLCTKLGLQSIEEAVGAPKAFIEAQEAKLAQ